MKKRNKQHDVRAASYKRMAVEHRAYWRSHRYTAKNSEATPELKTELRAAARMHLEAARILDDEAVKLRQMR